MKTLLFIGLVATMISTTYSQNCDLSETSKRRFQTENMTDPYSYVVQMTMKRGRSYNGTAFLIHPKVLLTAGHNLRKRDNIFSPRVKKLTLRFGSSDEKNNLYEMSFETKQFENIYTHPDFNTEYSIGMDYGIIILPNESAYKAIGGYFDLVICDTAEFRDKIIQIAGYPGDKPFCTQWQDSTSNYFFFKNYLHYDFATEHGLSGGPIWFNKGVEHKVFAIHTNGDGFDQYACNTATLITKQVYDDIVRFCRSKGIDITK